MQKNGSLATVRQKGPNISQEDTARLWYIYRAVVPNNKPIKNLLLILALNELENKSINMWQRYMQKYIGTFFIHSGQSPVFSVPICIKCQRNLRILLRRSFLLTK